MAGCNAVVVTHPPALKPSRRLQCYRRAAVEIKSCVRMITIYESFDTYLRPSTYDSPPPPPRLPPPAPAPPQPPHQPPPPPPPPGPGDGWTLHEGTNCWSRKDRKGFLDFHGAVDLEQPVGKPCCKVSTVLECIERCRDTAGCTSVTLSAKPQKGGLSCYRRGHPQIRECDADPSVGGHSLALVFLSYSARRRRVAFTRVRTYNTWVDPNSFPPPSPPAPPAPPPTTLARLLNSRFNVPPKGSKPLESGALACRAYGPLLCMDSTWIYSECMEHYDLKRRLRSSLPGVLIHQFDGYQDPNLPWAPCIDITRAAPTHFGGKQWQCSDARRFKVSSSVDCGNFYLTRRAH